MKKKTQHITIFIPVSQLNGPWKGELERLPANKTFDLILDYPFGSVREHHFAINTGKKGMGLVALLGRIGKAYEKVYQDPDKYGVFGHGIDDLQLEGIRINYKTRKIHLDIGS